MPDRIDGGLSFMQKILAGVATGALTIGLVAVITMTISNNSTAASSAATMAGKLDNISDKISDIQKSLPNFVTQDQFKQASQYRDLQLTTMQASMNDNRARIASLESQMQALRK